MSVWEAVRVEYIKVHNDPSIINIMKRNEDNQVEKLKKELDKLKPRK